MVLNVIYSGYMIEFTSLCPPKPLSPPPFRGHSQEKILKRSRILLAARSDQTGSSSVSRDGFLLSVLPSTQKEEQFETHSCSSPSQLYLQTQVLHGHVGIYNLKPRKEHEEHLFSHGHLSHSLTFFSDSCLLPHPWSSPNCSLW